MQRLRWFILTLVVLLILYFGFFVFRSKIFGFNPNFESCIAYKVLFTDSFKELLSEDLPCISSVDKNNIYNAYVYDKSGKVVLWKFKNFKNIEFRKISFMENQDVYDSEIFSGEVLSYKTERPVTVKHRLAFSDEIIVKLDPNSEIHEYFKGDKYLGFQGEIRRMVFDDSNGDTQIIFDFYQGPEPVLFYFFKRQNSLFFIMINSEDPIILELPEIIKID